MLADALFVARSELARSLRQKETILWTFLMPIVFFYFIGTVTGGFGPSGSGGAKGGGGGGGRAPQEDRDHDEEGASFLSERRVRRLAQEEAAAAAAAAARDRRFALRRGSADG